MQCVQNDAQCQQVHHITPPPVSTYIVLKVLGKANSPTDSGRDCWCSMGVWWWRCGVVAAVDGGVGGVAGCTCGAGWQALGSTRDGYWGVSL